MGYFDEIYKAERAWANVTRHVAVARQEEWASRNEMTPPKPERNPLREAMAQAKSRTMPQPERSTLNLQMQRARTETQSAVRAPDMGRGR
jgi:hypothetical protein